MLYGKFGKAPYTVFFLNNYTVYNDNHTDACWEKGETCVDIYYLIPTSASENV